MHPLNFKKLLFNCVSAPPSEVATLIVERFSLPSPYDFGPPTSYHFEEGNFDWKDAYLDMPEQGWRPLVCILWEPKNCPGHTVFMSTRSDGMSFVPFKQSKITTWTWVHVSLSDHESLPFPGNDFQFYRENQQRGLTVAVNEVDKWEFFAIGDPLPFEDLTAYQERTIAKRLTRARIFDYLREVGYDAESEAFWIPTKSFRLWQEMPDELETTE